MIWWLGLLQGVTEFLPISSSGHLWLAERAFLVPESLRLPLAAGAHLGTFLAIPLVIPREVWRSWVPRWRWTLAQVVLASATTGVLFLLFRGFVEDIWKGREIGWGFLLSAVYLWTAERLERTGGPRPWLGLLVGAAQATALLPGVSRTGATLMAGVLAGLPMREALAFAFIVGLPAMPVGALYAFFAHPGLPWRTIALTAAVSFLAGLTAGRLLFHFLRRTTLRVFAVYCALLGGFILVW